MEDFCREEQISPTTYYRWQRKYCGLQVDDAKRLKALEVENAKLKRLLAEAVLANDAIREFLEKKDNAGGTPCAACQCRREKYLQTSGLSLDRDFPIRKPVQITTSRSGCPIRRNNATGKLLRLSNGKSTPPPGCWFIHEQDKVIKTVKRSVEAFLFILSRSTHS